MRTWAYKRNDKVHFELHLKCEHLSNVTPRYLGLEQKGRVSLLKLTFSSHLWGTIRKNIVSDRLSTKTAISVHI